MNKKILILGLSIIIIIFISFYFIINCFFGNPSNISHIGTAYGILTAFFSAIAIIGMVYTIYQSKIDTKKLIDQLKENIFQIEKQQKINTLSALILIYDKNLKDEELIRPSSEKATNIKYKISKLTKELESYI